MMNVTALGAASGGKANYCQNTVSQEAKMEGYYQNSKDPAGVWLGSGLAGLGLTSGATVIDEAFAYVTRGYSPSGGDLGVQGSGDKHRAGWDLTFSATKSVSIVAAAADAQLQKKIIEKHNIAVSKALQFIEEKAAFCRRGKAGEEHEKLSGLTFATYQHIDSRESDPQLHTHALVMNLARRDDGSYGGIESKYLFEWKMAAGAVYRAELAKGMVGLGFEVKKDREFFQLGGIGDDICKHFSKRRTQIEAALNKANLPTGNAKTSEIAALATRKVKLLDVVKETLLAGWKTELENLGLDSQKINEIASGKNVEADNSTELEFIESDEILNDEPVNLFEHLAQHESVFTEKEIYQTIAVRAQLSGVGIDGIEKEVTEALESREIIKLRNGKMTTRRILEIETNMVTQAQILKNRQNHGLSLDTVKSALAEFTGVNKFELSVEQVKVVHEITESGDLKMVRGSAGSGKSTILQAAKIAWQSEGYRVIGAALSGKASAGLEAGSGIKAGTIHKMLFDIQNGKQNIDSKTVLVIDEAGMVGSRQMQKLTELVEKAGAKLVLVGDERQLQAVDAGGAFKLLQNQLNSFSELNEVRRQRKIEDRYAANSIASGAGSSALKSYIERGLIHVGETVDTTHEALVRAWANDTHKIEEKLIMAQTRNDVFKLNQAARLHMNLSAGQAVKTSTGEREISVGERIMITKNNGRLGVMNGQFATVKNMKFTKAGELQMSIKIDGDIEEVNLKITGDKAFIDFDHGYAATIHKAQGATVDSAYFYASAFSDKELGYVAMSRHRNQCQVFTPASKLEDALDSAGIEISADDFLEKNIGNTLKKLGEAIEKSNQKETTLDYISQQKAVEILAETKTNQGVVSSPSADAKMQEVEMEM
jgi:Ti-type conjugative transfer relaxase TraA